MNPTHAIILTVPAFDEIDRIIGILRSYSPETAQRRYARFWTVLKSLEWCPERFPIAPEDEHHRVGPRQVVFGKQKPRRVCCTEFAGVRSVFFTSVSDNETSSRPTS
jgi:hypothetical protein